MLRPHDKPRVTAMAALYPEVRAGGFSHVDGTVEFYQRVNALLAPEMVVVDFGAGRGLFLDDDVAYRRELHRLRGKVACVIGLDVDRAVLDNPSVDRAEIVEEGQPLPLDDSSVDMVVSDWTFEHVNDSEWAALELDRVLRHGGWICARTPNRWGYVGIGARLVPNRHHVALLRRFQPQKAAHDTFPTSYTMNSHSDLRRLFPVEQYEHCTYAQNSEPGYFGASLPAWRLARMAFRLTPSRFDAFLHVFLRKH
jgi:SAM-dependent methyltransferase